MANETKPLNELTEKAIQDYVVSASGLDDAHVIWDDGKPRPTGTYIAMLLTDENSPANDESKQARNPLVLADDVVEAVNTSTGQLTLTAHAYKRADGPVRFTTTGVLPSPLAVATDYWIIVDDVNKIGLSTSRHNALVGTRITLLTAGTGVHTIVDTAATVRVGEEIKQIVRGPRRYEITMQCFSTAPTGVNAARAILSKVVSRSQLPSTLVAFDAAGIGLIGFERVQTVGAVQNFVKFEPRARSPCSWQAGTC